MTIINENQGAIKLSEIAADNNINLISTPVNQDIMTVVNELSKVSADALRKLGFILYSTGIITWNGSTGILDWKDIGTGANANIILKLLQFEDSARTVDLRLLGNDTNTSNLFRNITLNTNEILYLELNRDIILNNSIGTGYIQIENGVNGSSLNSGYTLKKVTMDATHGIPQLFSTPDGLTTNTFNIPLAMRLDYTYNSVPYHDLYWIPHGIRWPSGTSSTLGCIIETLSSTALPDYFVSDKISLLSALTALQLTGGIICVDGTISVDQDITIYPNIQIIGKSWNRSIFNVSYGYSIYLQNYSEINNCTILGNSLFITGSLITINSGVIKAKINNCYIKLQNTSGSSDCIRIGGNYTRINDSVINTNISNFIIQFSSKKNGMANAVLDSLGHIWTWGANTYGGLGTNDTVFYSLPILVVGGHSFVDVAINSYHTLGLKSDGSVWAWGYNSLGQLGHGTTVNKSSPVSVLGGGSFVNISAGATFSLARKADGSVWAWGENSSGQLGTGTSGFGTHQSSPVSVIGGYNFIKIATGEAYCLAIRSDNTLWGWGLNNSGQLGHGDSLGNYNSPVSAVGGYSFVNISAGESHALGLQFNGSVWAWGYNDSGPLGQNNRINRSSPVSVLGGYSFIKIVAGSYTSLAIRSDNTAWTWGNNQFGQLGIGTSGSGTHQSSPVSVLGGHSFIQIVCGADRSVLARKADGSLWAWGDNTHGEFGNNTTTSASSPISIPFATINDNNNGINYIGGSYNADIDTIFE